MLARIMLAVGWTALAFGCAEKADDTEEIITNLVKAGFPERDIMVIGGVVYVGRDAEVSLQASREMLEAGDSSKEQYRTTNQVSTSLPKICIDGTAFTGVLSTALDLAIQNYDEQPLTFAMARAPSSGCSFTINAVLDPTPERRGGSSGFPAGGQPFHTITIAAGNAVLSVDTIEHVITHEIGHTLGFRHSDYFDRSISCGGASINEGNSGVGAIHIPWTPTDATAGASLMNSCFGTVETGEFLGVDVAALQALYTPAQNNWRWCHKCQGLHFGGIAGSQCPAGGAHEGGLSSDYVLIHSVASDPGIQDNWRWCHKCQGLFYAGGSGAMCPAGGAHDGGFSANYSLRHNIGGAPNLQEHWRWCRKCQGLFFGDIAGSRCPAGGAHDGSASTNYSLNHF